MSYAILILFYIDLAALTRWLNLSSGQIIFFDWEGDGETNHICIRCYSADTENEKHGGLVR